MDDMIPPRWLRYLIVFAIVLLNLIIAILSKRYEDRIETAMSEFFYGLACVLARFSGTTTLRTPPPINLVAAPLELALWALDRAWRGQQQAAGASWPAGVCYAGFLLTVQLPAALLYAVFRLAALALTPFASVVLWLLSHGSGDDGYDPRGAAASSSSSIAPVPVDARGAVAAAAGGGARRRYFKHGIDDQWGWLLRRQQLWSGRADELGPFEPSGGGGAGDGDGGSTLGDVRSVEAGVEKRVLRELPIIRHLIDHQYIDSTKFDSWVQEAFVENDGRMGKDKFADLLNDLFTTKLHGGGDAGGANDDTDLFHSSSAAARRGGARGGSNGSGGGGGYSGAGGGDTDIRGRAAQPFCTVPTSGVDTTTNRAIEQRSADANTAIDELAEEVAEVKREVTNRVLETKRELAGHCAQLGEQMKEFMVELKSIRALVERTAATAPADGLLFGGAGMLAATAGGVAGGGAPPRLVCVRDCLSDAPLLVGPPGSFAEGALEDAVGPLGPLSLFQLEVALSPQRR